MKADSPKTELNERILWYDGDSTVDEEYIVDIAARGKPIENLFVKHITPDIEQYNELVPKDQRIGVKENVAECDLAFNIPEEYATLDLDEYIADCLREEAGRNKVNLKVRLARTIEEFTLYEELDLLDVLRTLIYIINTLRENNIVWGVGRGSSVASYILYLIGVHDVDSVAYGLDIQDFLRP